MNQDGTHTKKQEIEDIRGRSERKRKRLGKRHRLPVNKGETGGQHEGFFKKRKREREYGGKSEEK